MVLGAGNRLINKTDKCSQPCKTYSLVAMVDTAVPSYLQDKTFQDSHWMLETVVVPNPR